jgi:hypothetical protein
MCDTAIGNTGAAFSLGSNPIKRAPPTATGNTQQGRITGTRYFNTPQEQADKDAPATNLLVTSLRHLRAGSA